MKITLETDSALCHSLECKFNRECANHITAGDYRTEGGFKPEITKAGDDYMCVTADRPEFIDPGEMFATSAWPRPDNFWDLERGYLTYEELLARTVNDYQI